MDTRTSRQHPVTTLIIDRGPGRRQWILFDGSKGEPRRFDVIDTANDAGDGDGPEPEQRTLRRGEQQPN